MDPDPTTPPDDVLRAGVIGVGWAGHQHADAYAALPGVELAGIAGLEERRAHRARRHATASSATSRAGRSCSRTRRSTWSASPCRRSCTRRSRSRRSSAGSTCCARSRSRAPSRRRSAMVAAARGGGPRARRRVQPPPARRHPGAQGGDRRRPPRRALLRQGVVAAAHRHPDARQLVHRPRPGRRRPAAGHRRPRARLLAVPARPAGDHRRERRPPTTCSAPPGFGSAARLGQDRRDGAPRSTSRTSRPCSCACDDGGTLLGRGELGRAPHGGRRVRDHALRDRGRRRADGARHGAERLAAHLHRRRRRPRRDALTAPPGRGHRAVVERFVETVRSGDRDDADGAGAAELARVVDACYRSAAEQREIRLDP